jgi:hypothetical protein
MSGPATSILPSLCQLTQHQCLASYPRECASDKDCPGESDRSLRLRNHAKINIQLNLDFDDATSGADWPNSEIGLPDRGVANLRIPS